MSTAQLTPEQFLAGRPKGVCFMTGLPGAEQPERFTVKGRGQEVSGRLWLSDDGAEAYAAARRSDATLRVVVALVSVVVLALCVAAALLEWVAPLWLIVPGALALLGLFVMVARPPRRVSGHLEGTESDQVVVFRGVHPDFATAVEALPVDGPSDAPSGGLRRSGTRRKPRQRPAVPAAGDGLEHLDDLDEGPVDVNGHPVDEEVDTRRFGPPDQLRLD